MSGATDHALAAICSGSGTVTCAYGYTGSEVLFTVPPGISSLSVTAVGGVGGSGADSNLAGFGADVTTTLSVTPGEDLYIDVGGNGIADRSSPCVGSNAGGFNGGGSGSPCGAGSRGGASGVYSTSNAVLGGTSLVVAGGGGGAGETLFSSGGTGGSGDDPAANSGSAGPNGGNGGTCSVSDGGAGGTQSSGGAGGLGNDGDPGTDGAAGQGGDGGNEALQGFGAGGGGEYFGGGGGGSDDINACGGGGGAGSSFADPSSSSGTIYSTDTTGTPEVVLVYVGPTAAAYSSLHIAISHGSTVLHWQSTERVLGFNVYQGSVKLNYRLVTSASHSFTYRANGVVAHPRLAAVLSH